MLQYDLVLKNGLVIDPINHIHDRRDIGIIDGKIAAVEKELTYTKEIIDVNGKVVMPGIIDMHAHVGRRFGFGGYRMIAETGVTTTIDLAGPIDEITEDLSHYGCGLNIGVLEAMIPGHKGISSVNPSESEIKYFLESSLERGAIGLKLFGGHSPLTPEATEAGMSIANQLRVMVAYHAGTTATKSDMTGMREAVELAKGKQLLLAHINAYMRGNVAHPMEELKEGLALLKDNKNIFSDSHLAVMNATKGSCTNGIPDDYVTRVCLNLYEYPVTEKGLEDAIASGIVSVMKQVGGKTILISGEEALREWHEKQTHTSISFPVNLPTVATGCLVEKDRPGGDFIIEMASTDGGGIPRNNLIKRMLSFYHLGYLSLEEVVIKISVNPARIFGFTQKGHLSIGADADITVVDLERSQASMSFVHGKVNMIKGVVLGKGGTLYVTDAGVKAAKKAHLSYGIIDFNHSLFYKRT